MPNYFSFDDDTKEDDGLSIEDLPIMPDEPEEPEEETPVD